VCVGAKGETLATASAAEVAGMLDVHVLGALRVTQGALPNLLLADAPLVVNVSSRLPSMTKPSERRLPTPQVELRLPDRQGSPEHVDDLYVTRAGIGVGASLGGASRAPPNGPRSPGVTRRRRRALVVGPNWPSIPKLVVVTMTLAGSLRHALAAPNEHT
jgi:NAD(P)-dependent dehydrogenase (short-subunit alcohol dehydrogenase family)